MHTDKHSSPPFRALLAALAALAVIAGGCSTQLPTDPSTPVLAIAHLQGASNRVSVFSAKGDTSDMVRSNYFILPESRMTYSALIGPDGDIYVSNFSDGTISIVSEADATSGTGPEDAVIATSRTFSSPDMATPGGMAFDERGDLWVIDVRNSDPSQAGPNRLVRFADPGDIADGASVDADTILDLAEQPDGFADHRYLYVIYIDDSDRLWYTDYFAWTIGRIDDLAGRGAQETDVVPDMQIITWDYGSGDPAPHVANPVGIAISDAGDLYIGSHGGAHVYRFDDAASWNGFVNDVTPDAFLDVGIDAPRYVAIDDEGALWALNNVDRELVRVVGHASGTGTVSLTPTRTLTWASWGSVFGGGMRFATH